MYSYSKYSKYCKTLLYSNFTSMDFDWWFRKNKASYKNNFNKIIVLLKCNAKQYNKKVFIISLMLIELLLKNPFINTTLWKNSMIFSKSFINKQLISVSYVLKGRNMIFFLSFFFTNISWTIYRKVSHFDKFKFEFDFTKQFDLHYSIFKLLDFTNFIKNKLQWEKYFLKKTYSFQIIFPGVNFLYFLWWFRFCGYNKFI